MKRITLVTVLLACGFLTAATPLFAQTAAPVTPENRYTGKATLLLLGRDDVSSAKFVEYREVPKGISLPVLTLQGGYSGNDFGLFGEKVAQTDQRFSGYANVAWFDVTFDYNQFPHNMSFNGQTLFAERSEGVWNMNATLRKALGAAVDAVPSRRPHLPVLRRPARADHRVDEQPRHHQPAESRRVRVRVRQEPAVRLVVHVHA